MTKTENIQDEPIIQPSPAVVPLKKLPEWVKIRVFDSECSRVEMLESEGISKEVIDFYEKFIVMSPQEAFELCCSTTNQAENPLWKMKRKEAITASRARKIFGARTFTSMWNNFVSKPIGKFVPQKSMTISLKMGGVRNCFHEKMPPFD